MSKVSIIFACTHCDAQYTKWAGRCLECGKWGSIERTQTAQNDTKSKTTGVEYLAAKTQAAVITQEANSRLITGIGELDRVLGGGIVAGSFILLGGEPGIGKSTLSLQLAGLIDSALYISGEESVHQIQTRAARLRTLGFQFKDIKIANETSVESVIATIREQKPRLVVVDSIQTIHSDEATGEPGNVTQIRACTTKLLDIAKKTNTIIVLIGHVTKDGAVAGPKTLEHLVDTVMYLEGDRYHNLRILRAVKNRFGSTDEIGMFEMDETGLKEVKNPSAALLEERGDSMPGSVVTCLVEGSRPLLVEVQALVNKTSFGYPVRKASGFDLNRLHVLIAVLQKRAGLELGQYDVHVNVVGGIRANEPAADLAVALSIASAFKDKKLGNDLAVFGEIGLGGEIRSVRHVHKRIKECEALGMKRAVTRLSQTVKQHTATIKIIDVKNIAELIAKT
ncbi:MAG: DNA repair protein RadA [Candidatus Magasanikbacteria bacterium CG10_big_fil_rev_8_21_14_0_10_47_10]|uniref:DNA repair protein RadA n=1 Tax=Candidatus Magasanikbacteria bacterium CG10_big_fil_rev_8_21_14_0_10_47_10 TaxID=1974652 RepID=A0A2H0TQN0_9BACT|nr:MAG: DNA repair protein RadA [Candidatus Magasanikbacteria bacterium CG10_big_fil_rev_8_21_14_0_10_47_10]